MSTNDEHRTATRPARREQSPIDGTVAGRAAQAAAVAASIAKHDYVHSWLGRLGVDAGITAAVLAYTYYLDRGRAQDAYQQLSEFLDEARSATGYPEAAAAALDATPDSGLTERLRGLSRGQRIATVLGALIASAGLNWLGARARRALAGWLKKRGIKRPHTLLGAAAGAGLFALLEVGQRVNRAKGTDGEPR